MVGTGVAPAGLYAEFGDKEGLYLRAMARYGDMHVGQITKELLEPNAGRGEIVRYFARISDRMQTTRRGVGCLWTNSATEFANEGNEKADLFRWNVTRMRDVFRRALENAKASGELADDLNTDVVASLLVTLLNGILLLGRGSADPDVIDRAVQGVDTLLVR